MGRHTLLTQGLLQIVLTSLSQHVTAVYASPLIDSRHLCPQGWYQYEHFCVMPGRGSTERAIALYCDELGGIGINGLCVISTLGYPTNKLITEDSAVNFSNGPLISASNSLEPASDVDSTYSAASEENSRLLPASDASSHFVDTEIIDDSEHVGSRLCPQGWTHYKSMCVYRPWNVEEKCSLLNSVEFRGLCIKHANTRATTTTDLQNIYTAGGGFPLIHPQNRLITL